MRFVKIIIIVKKLDMAALKAKATTTKLEATITLRMKTKRKLEKRVQIHMKERKDKMATGCHFQTVIEGKL